MSQPSVIDLSAPFDPTAYTSISGAQLLQLVANATPYNDKGLIVATADVATVAQPPDATVTTKWKQYIWLRIGAAAVTPYIWNDNLPNTDVTLLNWNSIAASSIGPGSITNSMIADNTILDVKIANLSYSKLIGTPTNLPPSGAATGDLTGTYPAPSVAANAITTTKILDGAITAAKVETCSSATTGVDYTKLRGDGVAKDMLRSKADSTQEWFTPPVLFTGGVVVPTANSLKIPQVNTGATDFQMVAATTLGRVLQYIKQTDTGTYNGTTVAAGAVAQNSGTDCTGLKVTFTPVSATSTILVRVIGYCSKITNDGYVVLSSWKAVAGAAAGATQVDAASAMYHSAAATVTKMHELNWKFSSATLGAVSTDVHVSILASTAGNGTINPVSGYTPANAAWIEVIEYL